MQKSKNGILRCYAPALYIIIMFSMYRLTSTPHISKQISHSHSCYFIALYMYFIQEVNRDDWSAKNSLSVCS